MPVNTGPDNIDFQISEVDLGDTFNTWRDITNLSVYKLNKFRMYEGLSSGSINVTVSSGGTAQFALQDNITTGVSFVAQVVFDDGVTFNGPVTFNAPTFTVNANTVTIDDYNLVLGDTAQASDNKITEAGGGGLYINRGSGRTASWIWNPQQVHGFTGMWLGDGHIGFSGTTSGLYPHMGATLDIHGTGLQLDGGATTEHGLLVSLVNDSLNNKTTNRQIVFSRYSPSGATAFMQVLNGSTYDNAGVSAGTRPFVSIPDGVNKKTVRQTGHSFVVGTPVALAANGLYFAAQANTPDNAEVVGVVSEIRTNEFEITFLGEVFGIGANTTIEQTPLITGTVYYLSPYYAGKVTSSQPTQQNTVHKAVYLATSPTSAIVMPWTGGVLTEPLNLAEATSTAVRINQLNQFKLGDVLRFKPGSTTLSYAYATSGSTTGTYSEGIFVRAQANSTTEAEVAGIVVSVDPVPATGVNRAFNLMMDGFFEFSQGVSATNSGSNSNFVGGRVYFLNSDCAGTTGSFEKASTPCYNNAPPTTPGRVRKPMLYTISPTKGYLFSYRGDVTGLPGISANTPLEDLLIQNLGSCGAVEDLRFGIRNASGSAGGTRVMTFDGTTAGNIRIGPSTFTNNSTGAGATLSVAGSIFAGDDVATSGSVIVASRYGSFPITLNMFGSEYSTGNSVIGYGVRPKNGAAGFVNTSSQSLRRTIIEIGTIGNGSRPGFLFAGFSGGVNGATDGGLGSVVPMTEYFRVEGGFGSVAGTTAYIGGSRRPALVLSSDIGNISGKIAFAEQNGALIGWEINPDGANQPFIVTDRYNDGATAMVIKPHTTAGASGCFVGLGVDAPATKLHVLGEMSTNTSVPGAANRGILLLQGTSTGGRQLQFGISAGTIGAWIEGWSPGLGGAPLTLQPSGSDCNFGGAIGASGDITVVRNATASLSVISTNANSYAQVLLRNSGLSAGGMWIQKSLTGYAGVDSMSIGAIHGSTLGFVTDNTLRMNLVGANLGIGTTTTEVLPTRLNIRFNSGQATLTGQSAFGGLHFIQQSTNDYYVGMTTNATTTSTTTQGGILIQGSGSYGTKIHLNTTDSYASGMKQTVTIDATGAITHSRGNWSSEKYIRANTSTAFASNRWIELSGLLPGYAENQYPVLRTPFENLYFSVNGVYRSYINGGNGTYNVVSDERLKDRIATVSNALDTVCKLRGVEFYWKDPKVSTNKNLGFIAQEVQKVIPEAVHLPEGITHLSLSKDSILPFLVEAIKELKQTVDAQARRISDLEKSSQ